MADYGAAVSQKGYDVKTCADRFLVYSSAFQTLKVFNTYSVSTTKPASGTNTITVTHNLGYFAPYVVIYNGYTGNVGTSYFFTDGYVPLVTRAYTNTTRIYVDSSFGDASVGDTVYFTVYVFLDDFSTIAENNINTGTSTGASSTDYGFRISKNGYDVKTCTNEQCVLTSSQSFNQIIHKKGTSTASSITHNLGYIPNYLLYDNLVGGSTYIEFTDPAFSGITSSALTLRGSSTSYYIIFKDTLT